jgi:hypothetical protein
MAEFDQEGQQVNTQINAETVSIYTSERKRLLSQEEILRLEKEVQKYIELDFFVVSRSETKVILGRRRKTSLGDWRRLIYFFVKVIPNVLWAYFRIFAHGVVDEKLETNLQKTIEKNVLGMNRDWVQLIVDSSGRITPIFKSPLLEELHEPKSE